VNIGDEEKSGCSVVAACVRRQREGQQKDESYSPVSPRKACAPSPGVPHPIARCWR